MWKKGKCVNNDHNSDTVNQAYFSDRGVTSHNIPVYNTAMSKTLMSQPGQSMLTIEVILIEIVVLDSRN